MDDKLLVFVLGAPGAGKGTQCEMVSKEFGWTHISAGDLLRAQVAAGTDVGKEAEKIMKEGQMVPAAMIIGLLKEAINNEEHKKILVDGFPRVLDQLGEFERQVRPCNRALFYNVAEETALQRIRKRAQNSGRADDNEETIHKRFVVFQEDSMPVVDALRGEGRLEEIDAAASADEVYAHTKSVIQGLEQEQNSAQAAAAAGGAAAAAPAEPVPAGTEDGSVPSAAPAVEAVAAVLSSENSHAALESEASAASTATPAAGVSADRSDSSAAASASLTMEDSLSPAAAAAGSDVSEAFILSATAASPATAAAAATILGQDMAPAPEASSPSATAADDAAAATGGPPGPVVAEDSAAAQLTAAGSGSVHLSERLAQVDVPAPAAAAEGPQQAAAASPAAVSPVAAAGGSDLQIDLAGIRTPIVICGPSGVGKGTLISKLMTQYPDKFGFSVSHTTREPRPGEQQGVHYNFTDIASMKEQVAAGLFLEHAEVHGNMYGTSLAAVASVSGKGKHCVLDIDVQGAQQVKASALGHLCLFVFIAPPSHEELDRRLRNRGTESEEKVLQRLANAEAEILKGQEPGLFDHILVNGELDAAYQHLQQLINQKIPGLLPAMVALPPSPHAAADPANLTVVSNVPAPTSAIANGTAVAQPAMTAALGGTSTLLDFGFGASAGPAAAMKGMPVRQYMDVTVIPILREGLKALNVARPDDPLQYLADFLVAHKPVAH